MPAVEIIGIQEENSKVKTLFFDKTNWNVLPGQFVMVHVPRSGEVPMALSYIGPDWGITVINVGSTTSALHDLEIGQKIGIRGPYGNGYKMGFPGDRILAVTGGTGVASIIVAVEKALSQGKDVKVAYGARSRDDMFFLQRLENLGVEVFLSTDDGSAGHHGFVTELSDELMSKERPDMVLACGPEIMMKKVYDQTVLRGIPIQASLERHMKCAVGICDSCSVNGYLVCKYGPVFSGELLAKMPEFGKYYRSTTGVKVPY